MSPGPRLPNGDDDRGPIKASRAVALLKALHIMNADGSISADMRRKFKQVNHLVELFRPVLDALAARGGIVRVVDLNCGNAYLSFLLDHYVAVELGRAIQIQGFDRNPASIATCQARALALARPGLTFATCESGSVEVAATTDLVVSLHGCDTATDEALLRAVQGGVRDIVVVPCCQRELRGLLSKDGCFAPFLHDGIVTTDFAATLTDVLRSLWLRTKGYRTEIIEFVPLEHSLKNRMIRARRTHRDDARAREQLSAITAGLAQLPMLLARSPVLTPPAGS